MSNIFRSQARAVQSNCNPLTVMYAKSVQQFLGGTETNLVDAQPQKFRDLCYDFLPVQYTELTHHLRKFLIAFVFNIVRIIIKLFNIRTLHSTPSNLWLKNYKYIMMKIYTIGTISFCIKIHILKFFYSKTFARGILRLWNIDFHQTGSAWTLKRPVRGP